MFDVPHVDEQRFTLSLDVPDLGDWQVGAIVGSSGRGKTLLARKLFPQSYCTPQEWSGLCLLDDFPTPMTPAEITEALTSVGLSSPPVWLRPHRVLSVGQQHRADLARALCQTDEVVYDEFTSVVDRTVAVALSTAVAKHVRRVPTRRFVAVSCHRDILPWLQPDWTIDLDTGQFSRECLQRPVIGLRLRGGTREAWPLFRGHHYLSADLSPICRIYLAYVDLAGVERVAGFLAVMPLYGHRGWWHGHRAVVLPDYQGLGVGTRMIEAMAQGLWDTDSARFRWTGSAPGLVSHCRRHPEKWRLARPPSHTAPVVLDGRDRRVRDGSARLTTNWVYLPSGR